MHVINRIKRFLAVDHSTEDRDETSTIYCIRTISIANCIVCPSNSTVLEWIASPVSVFSANQFLLGSTSC